MPQKSDQQLAFIPRGRERGYFLELKTVENKVSRGCLTSSYSQVEQLHT